MELQLVWLLMKPNICLSKNQRQPISEFHFELYLQDRNVKNYNDATHFQVVRQITSV